MDIPRGSRPGRLARRRPPLPLDLLLQRTGHSRLVRRVSHRPTWRRRPGRLLSRTNAEGLHHRDRLRGHSNTSTLRRFVCSVVGCSVFQQTRFLYPKYADESNGAGLALGLVVDHPLGVISSHILLFSWKSFISPTCCQFSFIEGFMTAYVHMKRRRQTRRDNSCHCDNYLSDVQVISLQASQP